MTNDVGLFFDALSDDYTKTIERCFPCYREMSWAQVDYLPADRSFGSVLELGCGVGHVDAASAECDHHDTLTDQLD